MSTYFNVIIAEIGDGEEYSVSIKFDGVSLVMSYEPTLDDALLYVRYLLIQKYSIRYQSRNSPKKIKEAGAKIDHFINHLQDS